MNFISIAALVILIAVGVTDDTVAQERLKTSYASIGATNAIWNIAKERGFYKKHGLDVDVVYIGSTTVTVAAILGQDVQSRWPVVVVSPTRRYRAPIY